ncbi:MAG: hypothetical protein YYHSYBAR_001904 [Candidatus Fervidibacter sacchari]
MQSIENMADPTDNKGIFLEGRLLPNHKISTWREYRPPTARPLMEISARQEPCPLLFFRMNSALWEKLIINRRLKPAAWAILEHSLWELTIGRKKDIIMVSLNVHKHQSYWRRRETVHTNTQSIARREFLRIAAALLGTASVAALCQESGFHPAPEGPKAESKSNAPYDWATHAAMGDVLKRDGLIFCNNRWAGEKGSMFVKFGPPACTWWTTHEGPVDPTFPVSAPLVGFGNFWGTVSENSPLPVRLGDLEVLRASLIATLPGRGRGRLAKDMPIKQSSKVMPAGSPHMYRICWQLYFSDSPAGAKYNKGDFAPTVFAVNCHPTWWGEEAGRYQSQGRTWKICDCKESSGMGRYIVPLLDPFPTPDANGRIEIRDVDLKAMIDWCIAKGYYRREDYLVFVSAGWEVWVLDEMLTMNDMCFVIKVKGKPQITIPSWSKLPSESGTA